MNPPVSARKPVTREQLSLLLEDALSAAAGWTVVPPQIQPLASSAGMVDWTVDTTRMDEALQSVVARMQQRYRLRAAPSGWRCRVAGMLKGRRPGRFGYHQA